MCSFTGFENVGLDKSNYSVETALSVYLDNYVHRKLHRCDSSSFLFFYNILHLKILIEKVPNHLSTSLNVLSTVGTRQRRINVSNAGHPERDVCVQPPLKESKVVRLNVESL